MENPTRVEFGIGEDADLILVADASHQSILQTAKDAIDAALRHDAFVLPLPQDGGIGGRIVIGELNADEQDNWVARVQRPLEIQTDCLVIDAGDFFGKEPGAGNSRGDNFLTVEIEPGSYLLTCLVYLHSDIATHLFRRHKFSYIELFQRSHPGAKIPSWLLDEAECREHEKDEEFIESLDESQIDDDDEAYLVDVLLHLELGATTESPTEISKTGRLRWEKRVPTAFPRPLKTEEATRVVSANSISRQLVNAFVQQDFDVWTPQVSDPLQGEVSEFLASTYSQITAKMQLPQQKRRGGSFAQAKDWIAKAGKTNSLVDLTTLKKHPFSASTLEQLVDPSDRYQQVSVDFHFGFVKTETGLRIAGLEVTYHPPRVRQRRRARVTNGPPCPECGERLATELAKQCLHCGANWH